MDSIDADIALEMISIENAKLLSLYKKSNNEEDKKKYKDKILELLQKQKQVYNANEEIIKEILENYKTVIKKIDEEGK